MVKTSAGGQQVLLFRTRSGLCAVPVADVVETLRPLPVEGVPGAPAFVRGVSVIRGRPVPVVELDTLLGSGSVHPAGRFVTLRTGSRQVALAVEAVLGVRQLSANLLPEMPPLLQRAELVEAVGVLDNELLLVLKGARIIPEAVWKSLEGLGGTA